MKRNDWNFFHWFIISFVITLMNSLVMMSPCFHASTSACSFLSIWLFSMSRRSLFGISPCSLLYYDILVSTWKLHFHVCFKCSHNHIVACSSQMEFPLSFNIFNLKLFSFYLVSLITNIWIWHVKLHLYEIKGWLHWCLHFTSLTEYFPYAFVIPIPWPNISTPILLH